jgi:hypothetical protein
LDRFLLRKSIRKKLALESAMFFYDASVSSSFCFGLSNSNPELIQMSTPVNKGFDIKISRPGR